MRNAPILTATVTLVMMAFPAAAQDNGRYSLQKTPDGIVRFDRQTGDIAICQQTNGQLSCRAAVDQSKVMQDRVDRLTSKIDSLERRVAALEKARSTATITVPALPSDADIDRTMNVVERFFRRFMGIVKEFNQPSGTGDQQGDGASKT